MDFSLLVSLVSFARAVGGVLVYFPFTRVWAWYYLVGFSVGLNVGLGFGLSLLCPGCGLGFIWLVCLWAIWLFLLRADAPPLIIGEVLSDFCFSGGLGLLYYSWLFVGLCPFGNKFLTIQKKNMGLG